MTMGPEGLQYGISGRFLRVGGRPALETAGCRAGRSPWKASSTATVVGVNECKRLLTSTHRQPLTEPKELPRPTRCLFLEEHTNQEFISAVWEAVQTCGNRAGVHGV